jgi:leucyl-tRNA synthetase
VWRLVVDEETGQAVVTDAEPDLAVDRALHRTIDGVHADLEAMRFNTAIAKLIELTNHVTKADTHPRRIIEPLVLMLAPFAPHLAEELWARLGHDGSLAYEPFPQADPALLVEDTVTCVVQVQGKVRAKIEVSPSSTDEELSALALAEANVQRAIDGREVRRVVVRAPKLVNIVV